MLVLYSNSWQIGLNLRSLSIIPQSPRAQLEDAEIQRENLAIVLQFFPSNDSDRE
jgi:hypothetical protein